MIRMCPRTSRTRKASSNDWVGILTCGTACSKVVNGGGDVGESSPRRCCSSFSFSNALCSFCNMVMLCWQSCSLVCVCSICRCNSSICSLALARSFSKHACDACCWERRAACADSSSCWQKTKEDVRREKKRAKENRIQAETRRQNERNHHH